ncbi:MAG: hypothetical protein EWM47_02290 [Anaerolineaceae bacterium]|nr:MAG: hypothetical protein EWM47_02290 [Anaerolineaceae bacterium]
MAAESNYSLSPLKPYDETMWDYFSLYDNMPYVWNADNEKRLTLESGNIIKGYRCQIKEPYEIKH